jgi:hypothetical protein
MKLRANWTVELYINNVLVDFTTADAAAGPLSLMFQLFTVYYAKIKILWSHW